MPNPTRARVGHASYRYSPSELAAAIADSGLSPGEVVFLTAGLGNLGTPTGDTTFEEVSRIAVEAIMDVVGPSGGIIAPTYTYSFGEGANDEGGLPVFDVQRAKSQLGLFSEWFRCHAADVRSEDPMVSVAALGDQASYLIQDLPSTSYGHGSIFERLLSIKSGVLNLGMGPRWTPFIHYVDFLCQVPHRYEKTFTGIIRRDDGERTVDWTYHVPVRIPNARGLGEMNGQAAFAAGLWGETRIGRSRILHTPYRAYFDFTLERSKRDPWNLAVGPAVDVSHIERL